MFTFYVLLVSLFGAYGALLYADPGHNVTLHCFASNADNLCWYKQVAGQQPQIISSFYRHSKDSNKFYNQFKDNKRFSVHTGAGFYHLNISNVQNWDSAMYYCGQTGIAVTKFNNGIFLVLKDSGQRTFLQQPVFNSVKPGGSVTLTCAVQTGTSDADYSVHWFKKEDSRNSNVGILYIDKNSSSRCVQSVESPAQSCVHSLSKSDVSRSDAGTYYCGVASCGEILLGRGTRLEVGGEQDDMFPILMHCMAAALLVSVVLNVILISILCTMSRRKHRHSGVLHPQSVPEYTTDSQNEECDDLQYVAPDFIKRRDQSMNQRSTEEETVYSELK